MSYKKNSDSVIDATWEIPYLTFLWFAPYSDASRHTFWSRCMAFVLDAIDEYYPHPSSVFVIIHSAYGPTQTVPNDLNLFFTPRVNVG